MPRSMTETSGEVTLGDPSRKGYDMMAAERIGAQVQIRLSELSFSRPPGVPKIMAAIGYFDDSRTEGQIMSVAGLIGDEARWAQFEESWSMFLDRHGVPYFHMKEMANPSGPFKKWLPPHDHKAELDAFFADVADTIANCGFSAFGATIRIKDLERFNSERGLNLDPYSLGAYGCMVHIKQKYPTEPVSMHFDRIEKVKSRLDKAVEYAEADNYYVGVADTILPIPLLKCLTFRDVRPIQAADFLAWEARKYNVQQNAWWEIEDRPETWNERFEHYQDWSRKKFGTRLPPARKSLNALLKRLSYDGIVWDYRALNIAHNARGGAWSSVSAV